HRRKAVLSIVAVRRSPQPHPQQDAGPSRRPPPTSKVVFPTISRTEYDPVHNVPRIGSVGLLCGIPISSGQTTGAMDNAPRTVQHYGFCIDELYNHSRTHLALEKDSAEPRPIQPPAAGRIIANPAAAWPHHRYQPPT